MTQLSKRKTRLVIESSDVVRERGRSREVVIEAQPYVAMVRLKGTRTAFPISYAAIYHAAARLAAAEKLAAKKAAKKGRR
jgi:hypothetical protein